jgi:hypothetical protein
MNVFEERILRNQNHDIIDERGVQKLAKLACIDVETAAKKVTTEEIKRDVNVILNCATFLQVRFAMVANSYINLMGTCLV